MKDTEERLHVWDFDPVTKKEFIKLMYDTALALEEQLFFDYTSGSKNANKIREIARRVHYSGEIYRVDPEDYYSEYSKPIEIWGKGNIPKVHRAIIEECIFAICDLVAPIVAEIDGLLISKRWHKIPDSDLELAILVEKRDSYLFVIDLILPLLGALVELESGGAKK